MILWQRIQSYVIVTIISVLIWLYAESENVKQQKPLSFNIRFVAPPGQHLAIGPAVVPQVTVTVRCATGQYAQLRTMQSQPIELVVEELPDNTQQLIDLHSRLEDSPIGALGVSFVDIQPSTVVLHVERLVEQAMTISTDHVVPQDMQLNGLPVIQPAKASVRLLASMVQDRKIEHRELQAVLDPEVVARLEENVQHELVVPVKLPQDLVKRFDKRSIPEPTIDPPSAIVTLTIRKQIDSYAASSVPILVVAPWMELGRFSIRLENNDRPFLDEQIELAGPSDVIEKIRNGQDKVWAELRLTVEDLETGITSKQLHINVPQGVDLESANPVIQFVITPREVNTSPAAAP